VADLSVFDLVPLRWTAQRIFPASVFLCIPSQTIGGFFVSVRRDYFLHGLRMGTTVLKLTLFVQDYRNSLMKHNLNSKG